MDDVIFGRTINTTCFILGCGEELYDQMIPKCATMSLHAFTEESI